MPTEAGLAAELCRFRSCAVRGLGEAGDDRRDHRRQGAVTMSHPIVHAEIRSSDPDATREFYANLFGWSYSDGAYPGYTFVAAGAEGGPPTAISPLQADADQVLFFVGVTDVAATL